LPSSISQKTVSKVDVLLRRLFADQPGVGPLWSWPDFRKALYENNCDVPFLDYLYREFRGKPSEFLPLIHNGMIPAYVYRNDGHGQPAPQEADRLLGQKLLQEIIQIVISETESLLDIAIVFEPEPNLLANEVLSSLREDGFDFIAGKVVPAEVKAVDLRREDDYLIVLIRQITPDNLGEIQHHHDESDKAFANQGWGAASSEARNFFVAVLRGLRELATMRGRIAPYKQPGKDGPLIDDFKTIGLFTEEEKNAVMHVWVLLSHSGPHVGIKEQDSARLSRLLAIGMTEWVALKFNAWENNGFKPL
jgi:hypothetical protein